MSSKPPRFEFPTRYVTAEHARRDLRQVVIDRIGLAITEPFFVGLGPPTLATKAVLEALWNVAGQTAAAFLRGRPDDELAELLTDVQRRAVKAALEEIRDKST